ncbi:hypothetical protein BpHYR1_024084 [Brachionus plicatilis]|uniref:Uncharacterized protein n=1 Tax=Brachionus plicatilis TaxID=10195 RepID=A0A3M7T0J2_BRAPC|nr:hypothetical protein BpHYR1_024084 [Brachionus plicatilis]
MITKTKRLENSTPKFSGNPRDDVDDCLYMVKQGFISANIEEKMEGLSIQNYVSKFLTLTNKISFMAEDEKMFHFIQGLKESPKRELQYNRYNLEKVQNKIQTKHKSDYSRNANLKDTMLLHIPIIIGRIEGISMKIGLKSGATHSVMNHMTAIKFIVFDHDDNEVLLGIKLIGSIKQELEFSQLMV